MTLSLNCLRRIGLGLWLVPLSVGLMAEAAPKTTVHLDPERTEIKWTLGGTAHSSEGTFKLKGGVLSVDPASGVAQGELVVDLATGTSGNAKRDQKMQDEVLESKRYPEATFHPVKVTGTIQPGAAQKLVVEGTFTIHGADHLLKLEIESKIDGSSVTATTHFSIPYVAWGMKDPSVFLLRVDKEVRVDVVSHGTVEFAGSK